MSSIVRVMQQWAWRMQLRRELLNMNDKALADIGVSRLLLKQGLWAYPWRTPEQGGAL